jgi:hypothetical protein
MFLQPVVDAHYVGPLSYDQSLYRLLAPNGTFLGTLVFVHAAPHQPALVLELRDPEDAVHAILVRPMIRMGSEPSKVWAVRDPNGNQIVDIVQELHLFRHSGVVSRASCAGTDVAVMLNKGKRDEEVFEDPSGAELVRLAKLPDSPWPGAKDQRLTISHQTVADVRIPLVCALVRLATRFGQVPTQPAKPGDVVFGQGRNSGQPGLIGIVDDVLQLFG